MGQKINPTGFRLSISRNWSSRWYASNRDFAGMLAEDIKVREYLKAKLKNAAVSRVLIERPAKNARITIFSARPGVVIGKKGEDIENLKKELSRQLGVPVAVNIEEVRKPEIDAKLIADLIRGKKVDQALNILQFTQKKAAGIVKKVLESAIANAEHNDGADIDDLKVKTIFVEQGATLKRFTARAKGRGNRISKPTCHVYVTVGN